jgi:hypothetical protein
MRHQYVDQRPFQTIEDSVEFMDLLDLTIAESRRDLDARLRSASGERYRTGLLLALHKLNQLSESIRKGKRILNDLHLIRTALVGADAKWPEAKAA